MLVTPRTALEGAQGSPYAPQIDQALRQVIQARGKGSGPAARRPSRSSFLLLDVPRYPLSDPTAGSTPPTIQALEANPRRTYLEICCIHNFNDELLGMGRCGVAVSFGSPAPLIANLAMAVDLRAFLRAAPVQLDTPRTSSYYGRLFWSAGEGGGYCPTDAVYLSVAFLEGPQEGTPAARVAIIEGVRED